MPKKKIGIVGHFMNNSFGITKPYVDFFRHFGRVILITPFDNEIIEDLDLLVLPGGPDVNPFRYLRPEDELSLWMGQPCWVREKFDRELLPLYIANRTPIFGICRGMQTLAVHFGAQLNQHMWHETTPEGDRTKCVHPLTLHHDGINLIDADIPKINFDVNSLHHQTVLNVPEGASILATYNGKERDKEIEALTYFPHYPAHTVQWHPEEIRDKFSISLISHLLRIRR